LLPDAGSDMMIDWDACYDGGTGLVFEVCLVGVGLISLEVSNLADQTITLGQGVLNHICKRTRSLE
jgi:hypothetical protein